METIGTSRRTKTQEMNEIARRIWDNQSPSLPLITRVHRVRDRLLEKGYDKTVKNLVLPVKGYKKYL